MKYFRGTSVIYAGLLTGRAASGSVTRDDNRGISSIEYNALGLPSRISVGSGSSIEYIYSADGTKLGSRYTEGRAANYALQVEQPELSAQPYAYISEDYDYIGSYEFRNRNLFRVNTPYGYYLAGEFTPYMRDYQGNNRNDADYYAYGLPTSDSDVKSYDPYLYGDKMLYTLKGLNIYDFLARTYAPDIARFMQPDPLATENHGVSPYVYWSPATHNVYVIKHSHPEHDYPSGLKAGATRGDIPFARYYNSKYRMPVNLMIYHKPTGDLIYYNHKSTPEDFNLPLSGIGLSPLVVKLK